MGLLARQVYSPLGKKIESPKNFSSNGLSSHEFTSLLADEYFRKSNNVPWSPGVASSGVEIISAISLARCFPGPATLVNLVTTVGESSQLLISKSRKLSKTTKDGLLAWFQVLAGMSGFIGIGKETILRSNKEDFNEVPFYEKIALTSASLLNVFSMMITTVEKSLNSMISANKDDRDNDKKMSEHRTGLTSALADRRCIWESLVMGAIPWVSQVGFIKKVVDVLVTYSAVAEGLDTFDEHGEVIFLPKNLQNSKIQKAISVISNPLKLFSNKNEEQKNKYSLCWPFNKGLELFIGNEKDQNGKGSNGIRNTCFRPIFEFFGCKSPLYYLDNNKNIVVEFDGKVQSNLTKEDKPTVGIISEFIPGKKQEGRLAGIG